MIPLTELSLPLSPAPGLKSDLQDGVEGTEEVESEREVASIAGGGDLPELIFGKTQIGAAAAQETEEPVPVGLAPLVDVAANHALIKGITRDPY